MFSRPSQCCYVRQNTLLTQFVFKVSAFGFNACTCAPLCDCCINNALIHFVPSCQDTCTQFVNVLDPLLVDLLLHYGPHFIVDRIKIRTVWWPKPRRNELCRGLHCQQLNCLTSHGLAHCLVKTRKSLTVLLTNVWQKLLHQ